MTLTSDEILEEMERASNPLITGGKSTHVRGCSYDMTIGAIFWDEGIIKGDDKHAVIPPGGVVSILTKEELQLPTDMCATAFAINKMSSQGFLVLNPGHVDPGFKGPLSVKALNIRKVPMPLHVGDSIFTVIFQRLSKSAPEFTRNFADRQAREWDFNKTVVETAPRTIFQMMAADRDGPYPGRDEVRSMITQHWTTWAAAAATIATLIFSGIAAYKALYPTPTATNTTSSSGEQPQIEVRSRTLTENSQSESKITSAAPK